MQVTDAQVHIWRAHSEERPWPEEGLTRAHRPVAYGIDDLLADTSAAGVDRAILVPPSWEGDRNDYVLEAVQRFPERFAAMVRVPGIEADGHELFDQLMILPGVVGVRMVFSRGDSQSWLADGTVDWLFRAAESQDVPIAVFAPGQAAEIVDVARRFAGARFLIDHAGLAPGVSGDQIDHSLDTLHPLGQLPNVAVKISSLPSYVDEPYPFPSLHPRIERLLQTFGPERLFWGSDLTRQPCPYIDSVRLVSEALPFLDDQARDLLLDRGVRAWVGWNLIDESSGRGLSHG